MARHARRAAAVKAGLAVTKSFQGRRTDRAHRLARWGVTRRPARLARPRPIKIELLPEGVTIGPVAPIVTAQHFPIRDNDAAQYDYVPAPDTPTAQYDTDDLCSIASDDVTVVQYLPPPKIWKHAQYDAPACDGYAKPDVIDLTQDELDDLVGDAASVASFPHPAFQDDLGDALKEHMDFWVRERRAELFGSV